MFRSRRFNFQEDGCIYKYRYGTVRCTGICISSLVGITVCSILVYTYNYSTMHGVKTCKENTLIAEKNISRKVCREEWNEYFMLSTCFTFIFWSLR
jgi:hypothetical protein